MITMRTPINHLRLMQSRRRAQAAWQGCAPKGAGRGCLRTPSFAAKSGVGLSDTQAISLSNPEALP